MTTWYFDYDAGADGNDGLSTASPKNSMVEFERMCAAGSFGPGDFALFKRGVTWPASAYADVMQIRDCDGTAGNPFTIGAYGDGDARPIISASQDYAIDTAFTGGTAPNYVVLKDFEIRGSEQIAVFVNGVHDWVIDNLLIRDLGAVGFSGGIIVRGRSYNVEIKNCSGSNIPGEFLYIGDSATAAQDKTHDVYIHHCKATKTLSEGIDCKFYTERVRLHDCYFEDCGNSSEPSINLGGLYHHVFGCEVQAGAGSMVTGIRVGAYADEGASTTGQYHRVERTLVVDVPGARGQVELTGANNRVNNCTLVGGSYGLYLNEWAGWAPATRHTLARNNIFYNQSQYPVTIQSGTACNYGLDYSWYTGGSANIWDDLGTPRHLSYVQNDLGQENNAIGSPHGFSELDRYTLAASAPGIGVGTTACIPWDYKDTYGNTGSPSGSPDIGWKEYNWQYHRTFESRFSSSAFDRWTSITGDVSTQGAASFMDSASVAASGLSVGMSSSPAYVQKDNLAGGLDGLDIINVRWALNMDDVSASNDLDSYRVMELQSSTGSQVGFVDVRWSETGSAWQARGSIYGDAASDQAWTSFYSLSGSWNSVEYEWARGQQSASDHGNCALFIGGSLKERIFNVDNDALQVDTLQLGHVQDAPSSMSGSMYIDALVVSNIHYLGKIDPVRTSSSDLQGLWLMEEASGATRANSASGTSGSNDLGDNNTVGQSASSQEGTYSASFTRSASSYLSIANGDQSNLGGGSPLFRSAWIKRTSIGTEQHIFSKEIASGSRSYSFYIDGSDFLNARMGVNGSWIGTTSVRTLKSTEDWYWVGFNWDEERLQLFIDGEPEPPDIAAGTGDTSSASVMVGNSGVSGTDQYFDGLIDEVVGANNWLAPEEAFYIFAYGVYHSAASAASTPAASLLSASTQYGGFVFPPRPVGRVQPSVNHSLWLHHPTGYRLAVIPDFISLDYTRVVNGVGELRVVLPPTLDWNLVKPDGWLGVWRRVGNMEYLDTETFWFIRYLEKVVTDGGQRFFRVGAVSALELLNRRLVAYDADTAQTLKSGAVDDIMKAVVRENMGGDATDTARDLSAYLTVQGDTTRGPTASKAFARRKVLQVAQELSQTSIEAGSGIYFDIVGIGTSGLEFRTYRGLRGIDHTSSSGLFPLVVSPEMGNLVDTSLTRDYFDETTFIYAGGFGTGSAREVVTASAGRRLGISPFNRREILVDGRQTAGSSNELEDEARSALRAGRPRRIFSAKLLNTPSLAYGLHWRWGDAITAEFEGEVFDCVVDGVRVSIKNGKEEVSGELRVIEDES